MATLAREAVQSGECSEELIQLFYDLANQLYRGQGHPKPVRSFVVLERDDAIQEAVVKCWQAALSFNVAFKNAYRYFQRVILNRWATLQEHASRLCRDAGPDAHCSLEALLDNEQDPAEDRRLDAHAADLELLDFEVEEIVQRWQEGPETLAEEFGCDVADIRRAMRGMKRQARPGQATESSPAKDKDAQKRRAA